MVLSRFNASRIFLVDPAVVVTTAQNCAPQETICDRSSWDEHSPYVPNLLIRGPRLRAAHPKNDVMFACRCAQHWTTVRARTIRVAHPLSIRFQINRKQETLMAELHLRLSRTPEKIILKTDANLRAATRDGTGAEVAANSSTNPSAVFRHHRRVHFINSNSANRMLATNATLRYHRTGVLNRGFRLDEETARSVPALRALQVSVHIRSLPPG